MQDVVQVMIFALCVLLGWYFWPILLGAVIPAPWSQKHPKVVERPSKPLAFGWRSASELHQDVDGVGLALLENYGVLDAACGAWARVGKPTKVEPSQEDTLAYFQAAGLTTD